MRLRWVVWGALLGVQLLVTVFPVEALGPVVAGSVYLPLMLLSGLGLRVYGPGVSGGWAPPSLLGWLLLALFWGLVWWGVVSLGARLMRPRAGMST
ncbi:hypothetical protein MFUL124B02_40075 [Myxococcus fulvus 124B02]|nr:hypothetical protein MFUL124B02_40075 [Myxococcus fulvus 124B02]